jgi:DNA processing protein
MTEPVPSPLTEDRRDLLVALGASQAVPRSVACRLAGRLEEWAACRWSAGGAAARALGVPEDALAAARELRREAPGIARAERLRARELGGRVVTRDDPEYPPALSDLDLPPPALWIRGTAVPGAERSVAIVGSRRADPYGREAAELFARELAAAGLTVVSGFALGVDAAAHRGALTAAEDVAGEVGAAGPPAAPCLTVAVLGSGLGVDYPRGHRRLGERIAAAGAVVTEFPCGVAPEPWHFPVRNRLIAALAAAVLVVRAAPRSGSLITARLALDLGRDVFAVPGGIFDRRSHGTNALIADGAYPALETRDILEVLGVTPATPAVPEDGPGPGKKPTGLRARVLDALVPAEPTAPEALAAVLSEPIDRLLGVLLELELEGRIRREPGPTFVRRP